jgi:hypothetical protein
VYVCRICTWSVSGVPGGKVVDVSGMRQIDMGTDLSIHHGYMLDDASPCAPPYGCMADTEYKQEAQL